MDKDIAMAEANRNGIVTSYLRTPIAHISLLIGLYETHKRNSRSADDMSPSLTCSSGASRRWQPV